MTKKIKLKDKKVSPSCYIKAFIIVLILLVAICLNNGVSSFDDIKNIIPTNTADKYEKVTSISYTKELDTKKTCENLYFFYSGEAVIEKPVIAKKATVVNRTLQDAVTTPNIEAILNNYNLSLEQFYTIVAIVAAEGGGSYIDAYAVINVIYNRTLNTKWTSYANSMGLDGSNLFIQATLPSQFTVYASGSYLNHMYETDTNAYNATVTLLTTKESLHNYMSFRDSSLNVEGVQFIEGGNIYFSPIY